MFRKKKKASRVEATREPAPDFLRRPQYEACRAPEYRLYPKLEEETMLPLLDRHLEAMFAGTVDDGNGDLLDSLIFAPAREAEPSLARQRWEHEDTLRRIIARRKADREDFGRILEQRKLELRELEAAYAGTCRRMARSLKEE